MIDERIGRTPISQENAVGIDIRYESVFEILQTEVDKLYSPAMAGDVNWQKICELATEIIQNHSKDLTTAAYLGVALVKNHGIAGFEIGLTILMDMSDVYWNTLFPPLKKKKRRLGAIEWWCERGGTALALLPPESVPQSKIKALLDRLEKFNEAMSSKLASTIPLYHIVESLELLEQPEEQLLEKEELSVPEEKMTSVPRMEEKAQPKNPPPSTEKKGKTAPSPLEKKTSVVIPKKKISASPMPLGEMVSLADAKRSFNQTVTQLKKIAEAFRANDISDPLSYAIVRFDAWVKVNELPPAKEGKTQIPSPGKQEVDLLKKLFELEKWVELINASENNLGRYIFWMDLNRYTAVALEKMGSSHADALETVRFTTSTFCCRLRGIESYAFSDGLPFASDDTLAWIETLGVSPAVGTGRVDSVVALLPSQTIGECGQDDRQQIVERAKKLVSEKNLHAGMALLQGYFSSSVALKDRFLWQIEMAALLLASNQEQAAFPLIINIVETIEKFRLQQWDPEMSMRGLLIAWTGLRKKKSCKELADKIYGLMARIDPARVLLLEG